MSYKKWKMNTVYIRIITVRKQSLGQGNVFTPVILFMGECLPGQTPH